MPPKRAESLFLRALKSEVNNLAEIFSKKTTKDSLEELLSKYLNSDIYLKWQNNTVDTLLGGLLRKTETSIKESLKSGVENKQVLATKLKKIKEDDMLFTVLLAQRLRKEVKQNIDNVFIKMKEDALGWLEHQSKLKRLIFKLRGKDRTEALSKYLKKKNIKWADTIARTNTSRLNTHIIETRSKLLGIIAYIWDAENDRRTRSSHRFMNDVIVFWDDVPTPGIYEIRYKNNRAVHAGQDFNCRCTPKPIIDWMSIFNGKGTVRVWVNGRVETMSTKQLKLLVERKLGVKL